MKIKDFGTKPVAFKAVKEELHKSLNMRADASIAKSKALLSNLTIALKVRSVLINLKVKLIDYNNLFERGYANTLFKLIQY